MATIDKSLALIFCPLCGTAKESDVFIAETDVELAPKFYCGTIVWSFQKQVKFQGAKCRIIQKLRAPKMPEKPAFPSVFGKDFW
jgi:hypothetical protein